MIVEICKLTAGIWKEVLLDSTLCSEKQMRQMILLSTLIGFVMMLNAIHPTWRLFDFKLLLVFVAMSVLSVTCLLFSLFAYHKDYWESSKYLLFYGATELYITIMTLLSSFSCLFAIDLTGRTSLYLVISTLFFVIIRAALTGIFRKRIATTVKPTAKAAMLLVSGAVIFLVLTRFIGLLFDSYVFYAIYGFVSVIGVALLSFGFYRFKEYKKTSREEFTKTCDQ